MPILIVEDNKKLSDILKMALKGERYSVDTAFDGEEATNKAMKNNYSLILLDVMLPKKDGFILCQELRDHQIHTPIIMLTAKGSLEDRVAGLNFGADDYMIKPFSTDELFARIRTVLRRKKTTESDIRKVADLIMDKKKHEVTRGGKVLPLTPKEYKLLDILITNPGEAIKRRQLIDTAWGPEFIEKNNELNVHMQYLRTKVDKNSKKPLLHTIRGVGFVLKD
ncbi:MAG: DNA-binding response regulator [Candidatus Zambryskibacteria bacterium CG_4_9_14_3_um_filter_42_9]|uniref:DNA-binding response regulator n=1 Tax=Candidatus Zambryskibacteria bacterium CG22_combo_CG10-13_8_21_14_all_42_17 TaxID=1975118 RepID=A0A2H0BCS6_9BACT|nr:MAG: DNA-binding response regulator [Candidatus Zambryskibacteria bacterium CG22_combo_CG10-13_8_21_14_all_42_17]PJA36970.1 MAG: DNA-binding response regulator [Candidatus Zambryskibacteria bacterium CG_4_9_14_3_um_filter_42_9]